MDYKNINDFEDNGSIKDFLKILMDLVNHIQLLIKRQMISWREQEKEKEFVDSNKELMMRISSSSSIFVNLFSSSREIDVMQKE